MIKRFLQWLTHKHEWGPKEIIYGDARRINDATTVEKCRTCNKRRWR